ncbi:MAG: HAD family phosphatase, partial [Ruminococcus sp.]|nr:HAD family phosphatase [Ruminococcus sp.]
MIKGIIFDLDGTLIDSMKIWYDVDRNFLRENGITDPPADISERVKKMTVDQSSQYFIDLFNLSVTKEYVIKRIEDMVREEYEHHIPLKPYVEETLDMLDGMGIPYGVAT